MKFLIILTIVAISCNSTTSNIKEFIPGVYIQHFEGLYSKGDDTLIISKIDGVNAYLIVRKTSFQRISNNRYQHLKIKLKTGQQYIIQEIKFCTNKSGKECFRSCQTVISYS
jgi:hypothetical protein